MPLPLYMDVHVPAPVTEQLRKRGVDVLTAAEDDALELSDERLLLRATELRRVLFTQDVRFKALADRWNAEGRVFGGLVFGHQLGGTIGQFVRDLELIAKASEPDEWLSATERIPF